MQRNKVDFHTDISRNISTKVNQPEFLRQFSVLQTMLKNCHPKNTECKRGKVPSSNVTEGGHKSAEVQN